MINKIRDFILKLFDSENNRVSPFELKPEKFREIISVLCKSYKPNYVLTIDKGAFDDFAGMFALTLIKAEELNDDSFEDLLDESLHNRMYPFRSLIGSNVIAIDIEKISRKNKSAVDALLVIGEEASSNEKIILIFKNAQILFKLAKKEDNKVNVIKFLDMRCKKILVIEQDHIVDSFIDDYIWVRTHFGEDPLSGQITKVPQLLVEPLTLMPKLNVNTFSIPIDEFSSAKDIDEIEFKTALRKLWPISFDLMESEEYQDVIELWSPLESSKYFSSEKECFIECKSVLCAIVSVKSHLFISHIKVWDKNNLKGNIIKAGLLLCELCNSPVEILNEPSFEVQKQNLIDTINIALKWLNDNEEELMLNVSQDDFGKYNKLSGLLLECINKL